MNDTSLGSDSSICPFLPPLSLPPFFPTHLPLFFPASQLHCFHFFFPFPLSFIFSRCLLFIPFLTFSSPLLPSCLPLLSHLPCSRQTFLFLLISFPRVSLLYTSFLDDFFSSSIALILLTSFHHFLLHFLISLSPSFPLLHAKDLNFHTSS